MIAGLDGYEEGPLQTGDAGKGSDGIDGSTTSPQVDSGPSGFTADSAPVILEAGTFDPDAGHDSGPPSDAACTLVKNGLSCSREADKCCSGKCDEHGTCTGNGCATTNCNSSKGFPTECLVAGLNCIGHATGDCCVGSYCVSGNSQCGPCKQKDESAAINVTIRTGTQITPGTSAILVYDDACCSGVMDANYKCL